MCSEHGMSLSKDDVKAWSWVGIVCERASGQKGACGNTHACPFALTRKAHHYGRSLRQQIHNSSLTTLPPLPHLPPPHTLSRSNPTRQSINRQISPDGAARQERMKSSSAGRCFPQDFFAAKNLSMKNRPQGKAVAAIKIELPNFLAVPDLEVSTLAAPRDQVSRMLRIRFPAETCWAPPRR